MRIRKYSHPGKPRLRPEAARDIQTWIPTEWIPERIKRGGYGAYVRMCVEAIHRVMKEKEKAGA